ncbi:LLM class flavin-dependent oxidoreductase [Sporomusa aerivorans]|uniref:LLM class flavin-dependent oxidoreductase n=1 Tax=Sporomusa aerivorans TaxID=204936 RepID=UPI00352AA97C
MPKSEAVPEDEARDIEFEIKKYIAGAGSNVTDVVRRLNEKYGTHDTAPNITRQLKHGTLPFWKLVRIADVLGYEIIWRKLESQYRGT